MADMDVYKKLKELSRQFKAYEPVWEHWRIRNLHTLTPQEICTIEAHRKNGFKLPNIVRLAEKDVDLVSLIHITKKLKADRRDFADWVVSQFQFDIIRIAKRKAWDVFYNTPILDLEVSGDFKACLETFRVNTLEEFFNVHSDKSLKSKEHFPKIIEILAITQRESKPIINLKKEVG